MKNNCFVGASDFLAPWNLQEPKTRTVEADVYCCLHKSASCEVCKNEDASDIIKKELISPLILIQELKKMAEEQIQVSPNKSHLAKLIQACEEWDGEDIDIEY